MNTITVNYDTMILLLSFENVEHTFDLRDGDASDFWHSFEHKGKDYDINFFINDDNIAGASVYGTDEVNELTVIDTSDETYIDNVNESGDKERYKTYWWYNDLKNKLATGSRIVFQVKDLSDNQTYMWGIEEMLNEVNHNVIADGFSPYTEHDWFDGWVEGDTYELMSVNGKFAFGTVACKDAVEHMLEAIYRNIGIDQPENHEDITQFCYEDVMETAQDLEWHSGDVAIAFRRFLETKSN